MTILSSAVDPRSEAFRGNEEAMAAQVADLRSEVDRVRLGGGEAARAKHLARGKLLPRDRVRGLGQVPRLAARIRAKAEELAAGKGQAATPIAIGGGAAG